MSSEKYIKLQSQQNGLFTPANNRVDFVIPASYGKVSLKDSFVQVYCQMNTVDGGAAPDGEGIYQASLRWKNAGVDYNNHFNNVALIRNAHISSANKGMIESVRRTDVLRQNMDSSRQSQTNVDSNRYMSANSLFNLSNGQKYGLWTDVNKTGSVRSVNNLNTPIMIRLGDILDFCNVDVIDFMAMGDTRVHLELNLENVEAQLIEPGQLANAEKMVDIAQPAADTAITELTTLAKYSNLNQSGYWVGQKLQITGEINGTTGAQVLRTITAISQNANGSLLITFNGTLFTLTTTGGGATGMTIDNVAPTTQTAEFTRMECVLKQMPQSAEAVQNVLYTQFDTYELLGNGATGYTNVVEIAGQAENAVIMPINANGIDATLAVSNFRISCNNVELTDSRSVVPYSPLYYDRFVAAMSKSDYVVNNLQNPLFAANQLELYSAGQNQIIAMPLPTTANRKNLQVNINSAGLGNFILYTAIPRILSL